MRKKRENLLFHEYFEEWVTLYKEGAVRKITLQKYHINASHIKKLVPELKVKELNRKTYQELINGYAKTHEKQTTMDFHHQIKGSIIDAVEEGLIKIDPTRKVVIKGKTPRVKKVKYLNQFELRKLMDDLSLPMEINFDWLLLLIAKTGLRFSEALALTPEDFDFQNQIIHVNKTWNYKEKEGGFTETKNNSSKRKIPIDWKTSMQFSQLIKNSPINQPIFIKKRIFNSTINDLLTAHCKNASIPVISIHGLRHTHASLLLFAGVSIASVAKRLGHSNMTTTQKTYLHIIQELENQDNDKIVRFLSGL